MRESQDAEGRRGRRGPGGRSIFGGGLGIGGIILFGFPGGKRYSSM